MKTLLTGIILGAMLFLTVSELKAQSHLPQGFNPKSDNYYLKKQLNNSLKQLMINDSLIRADSNTNLNINAQVPKTHSIPESSNAISSPGKIPANPKDYMNRLDINGNTLYMPKSSLGLMTY